MSSNLDKLLADEFPLARDMVYLNHAAVSPIPKRTADEICRFVREYVTAGARDYAVWLETESKLRDQLKTLINAPSRDDIALLKNTSEALSVVAHGFPWRPGDNVVISDEEFPSNRVVWESLAEFGVTVHQVSLHAAHMPEQALTDAIDARTRLVAVSAVQFASGLRLDLDEVGRFCRSRNVAFCVDAIQALGGIQQDVQAANIDFLMADGHKWMLSPEGLAVFYCHADWRERLRLHQFGWHMRDNAGDFDAREWQPARTACRFECGSPNMLGIHALSKSLELLLEIGIRAVEDRILERARYLFQLIHERPDLACITDQTEGRYAGIVQFRSHALPAEVLHAQLRDKGVIAAVRGGALRYSPHCYTPLNALSRAVQAIPSR
ncbi:MAG: aminotransferase class V-fold PLP-dependent enzyme [Gammaproteobacteria bacterium]|nr:aminotransferase class V-fold PLP-dependent enzyme [Gammaproteobacteria bacterium]